MTQQANVTLNSVVYAPAGTTNGLSTWVNRSGAVGNSFSKISEKFAEPSKDGQVQRMNFSLAIPIVAADDTACVCAGGVLRTSTVQISVWVPLTSTSAERIDFWTRLKDFVLSDPIKLGIENLDPSWG
nr:MAG: hypothetical protein 2 [Leviviridae sp.]